jgi:CubicO group peptidase (beta-lactamase class C family)
VGRSKSSGGFDVRKVEAATDDKISVIAQSRRFGYWHNIQMAVTPAEPHKLLGVRDTDVPPPPDLLPAVKLTDAQVCERVDALVTKLIDADQFSGAILVARGTTTVYQRAAGLANRQWNVPNRVDTKFNLASIGKMFTAVAVAQLVEQGKLSYDDTVGKVLPDYPNADVARRVTV